MDYQDVVSWMFQQLPVYQNIGNKAFKKDLTNSLILSNQLLNPESKFKTIHVAGTNGKGSVSHMLASIFQEAGYKTGLYTSPHLKDFRERIKVNGQCVSEAFVIDFITSNKAFLENNRLSFFEMTVGMAFKYFEEQRVDIAIIEVGLGGRLDSTNIINPLISVITNIGLDHTQMLGNTIAEIAREKAGIIKTETPVVIGESNNITDPIFEEIANEKSSQIYFSDKLIKEAFDTDLKGNYQKKNILPVMQTLKIARKRGFQISEYHLKTGLLNVIKNTGLQGRWQILQDNPKIICDTAHNKEGLTYVFNQLLKEDYEQLHIVFGVVKEKDLDSILSLMPTNAKYYFCKPNIERGLDSKILQSKFEEYGFKGNSFNSVGEAMSMAKKMANEKDLIFIGGSTFVVAEIL